LVLAPELVEHFQLAEQYLLLEHSVSEVPHVETELTVAHVGHTVLVPTPVRSEVLVDCLGEVEWVVSGFVGVELVFLVDCLPALQHLPHTWKEVTTAFFEAVLNDPGVRVVLEKRAKGVQRRVQSALELHRRGLERVSAATVCVHVHDPEGVVEIDVCESWMRSEAPWNAPDVDSHDLGYAPQWYVIFYKLGWYYLMVQTLYWNSEFGVFYVGKVALDDSVEYNKLVGVEVDVAELQLPRERLCWVS